MWFPFFFPIFLFLAKNVFRVGFQDPSPDQSLTLQANDVFHKQQWINCIRAAIAPFQQATSLAELQGLPELHEECVENNSSAGNVETQRRASTASSVTQVEVDGDASACLPCVHHRRHEECQSALSTAWLPKAKGQISIGCWIERDFSIKEVLCITGAEPVYL